MNVQLRAATPADRPALERMLAEYTAIISALSDVPDPERTLEDVWFEHPDLHPYVIDVDGGAAGMALVMGPAYAAAVGEDCDRVVADYFVEERWRGRGVARRAARALFDTCPGRWSISVIEANGPALGFWRAVLRELGVAPGVGRDAEGLTVFRFVIDPAGGQSPTA